MPASDIRQHVLDHLVNPFPVYSGQARQKPQIVLSVYLVCLPGVVFAVEGPARDWRNVRGGNEIPSENYAEMPYVAVTKVGNWLGVLTTGPGGENAFAQHVVATISTDQGKTYANANIRPPDVMFAHGATTQSCHVLHGALPVPTRQPRTVMSDMLFCDTSYSLNLAVFG